ncbi:Nn.00g065340.m01.CDS01 [Neocucurbitaria sp. VM-36]
MIQPGLERIGQLLKNVHFPWKSIHVAGTNGKGSICHYASSLLIRRHVKCGKFTSPHLVDRWDCISINGKTVDETLFRKIETHYTQLSQREGINASSFEILTATAFHIFNEEKVEVGVVEVGMGGKLDATNILNNQAVCVISKIARDHQNFLGTTLEEIAQHKAGILKPNVPYIVNPLNEWNVHNTIDQYAKEIGAGPRLTGDDPELKKTLYSDQNWHRFAQALRPFQRDNAVLAVLAVKETCKRLGLEFGNHSIAEALVKLARKVNPGRLQYLKVQPVFGKPGNSGRDIVVDGAHNPDAAQALKDFVFSNERLKRISGQSPPRGGWPVTWVLAMTEGKDALQYLQLLLQPGDNVFTTSFGPVDGMPWVKPMDPKQLLEIAKTAQHGITGLHTNAQGALRALCAAKYITEDQRPIVLTGSLYLVGDLHREMRARGDKAWWIDPEREGDRAFVTTMHEEERRRVNQVLSLQEPDAVGSEAISGESEEMKRLRLKQENRKKLQDEIETLDRQMEHLEAEEQRLSRSRSFESKTPPADTNISNDSVVSNLPLPKGKFFTAFEDLRRRFEALPITAPSTDLSHTPTHSSNDKGARSSPQVTEQSSSTGSKDERDVLRADNGREDVEGSEVPLKLRKHLAKADGKSIRRRKSA